MATWIYLKTITTPTGSRIDEIRCPMCKNRQTLPEFLRPDSCYTCGAKLEKDERFKAKIIELLTEDGVVGCGGANV